LPRAQPQTAAERETLGEMEMLRAVLRTHEQAVAAEVRAPRAVTHQALPAAMVVRAQQILSPVKA